MANDPNHTRRTEQLQAKLLADRVFAREGVRAPGVRRL